MTQLENNEPTPSQIATQEWWIASGLVLPNKLSAVTVGRPTGKIQAMLDYDFPIPVAYFEQSTVDFTTLTETEDPFSEGWLSADASRHLGRSSWELQAALGMQAGLDAESVPITELAGEMFVDAHQRNAHIVSYAQALDLKETGSSFAMATWDDGEAIDMDHANSIITVDDLEPVPSKEGYDNTPIQLLANTVLRYINGQMMIAQGSYKFTFSSTQDGEIQQIEERIDPITGNVTILKVPYAATRAGAFRGSNISTLQ